MLTKAASVAAAAPAERATACCSSSLSINASQQTRETADLSLAYEASFWGPVSFSRNPRFGQDFWEGREFLKAKLCKAEVKAWGEVPCRHPLRTHHPLRTFSGEPLLPFRILWGTLRTTVQAKLCAILDMRGMENIRASVLQPLLELSRLTPSAKPHPSAHQARPRRTMRLQETLHQVSWLRAP